MQPCSFVSFSFLQAAVTLTTPLGAQSVRVNGPLVQPGASDVVDYRIDPGGDHVVYLADQNVHAVQELFSAPADGSDPAVRLNGDLPPGGDVKSFEIAAGGRVLYVADQSADQFHELFSVPIDGSASPVAISGPLASGQYVMSFQLTPDLARAVFLATKLVSTRPELFVVPVDGSAAPLRLDPLDRPAEQFWITPDGSSVLYSVPTSPEQLLYRVPLDASQLPLLLAGSVPATRSSGFTELQIDLDGQHAVYETIRTTIEWDFHHDLYAVALDASAPAALLSEPGATGFDFVPAGDRVIYHALGALHSIAVDGTDRRLLGDPVNRFAVAPDRTRVVFGSSSTLYSAPVDGSQPPLALAQMGGYTFGIEVSPNSALVVFGASDADGFRGLWLVPITGTIQPVLLNRPRLSSQRGVLSFAIAPGAPRIVYTEDREQEGVLELYGIDASLVPVKLSEPLGGSGDVLDFRISADGQQVAYRADATDDQTFEIFGAPIDGSLPAVRYNAPLALGPVVGDVLSFRTIPATGDVVYHADETADEVFDLYTVGLDAPGVSVRLTGALTDAGDATGLFAVSPAGDRVVLEIARASSSHLYSVPSQGGTPVEIDSTASAYESFAAPLAITSDGSRVVYRVGSDLLNGTHDLRSAPVGGGPVVPLASPAGARTVTDFQLSPDGNVVVYRADQAHDTLFELYRVPVDGSVPPQRLNAPLSGERDVDAFRITPDGLHVVYLADQARNDQMELWSVPLAGGDAPERLNGILPTSGDVTDFRLTDDGRWVVFRADPERDSTFELFRARVAGRRPWAHGPRGSLTGDLVRLTHLPVGRNVQRDFVIGPGVLAVFFRADAALDDVIEVFRVPIDGSAPPVKVSADPLAGGDVSAFAIAPDGSRIVYTADARFDGVTELFGVPVLGGKAVAYDTLPAFADVTSFRIAPDSGHVGWLADRDVDGTLDLFLAPLDASLPPRRANDLLPTGGNVDETYRLLSGGSALYRADQEADGVFELFLGSF